MPAFRATRPPESQAKSLFETAVHSDRYLRLAEGMGRVDFTSYALIEGRRDMFLYWSAARPAEVESRKAVNRYSMEHEEW